MDVGGLESGVIGLVDGGRGVATESTEDGRLGIVSYLGCLYGLGAQGGDVAVEDRWVGDLGERGFLRTLLSLRRFALENRIDLIHTHNPQPHLFGVLAGLLCRIPVVHTKHGRNYPEDRKRVWLNRQLSRLTRKVVAVSDDAARVAVEIEKVSAKKVMVIRNGIDVSKFSHRDHRGHRDHGRGLTIGTVGRLSEDKNYSMLIRAFARMQDRLSTAHSPPFTVHTQLLLVGDGPEREELQRAATEVTRLRREAMARQAEGAEALDVRFAGMRSNVEKWLRKMDIFCLSSVTEGTSMTLLEAGASGLPSVVTDVGGNREIVADGESGFVVPPGDEEAFAEALAKLVADAELRVRFGRAARERVLARYSMESMVDRYIQVYGEAVGSVHR